MAGLHVCGRYPEEVQRLLDRWGECAQRIENADVVIRMADESRDPSPDLDQDALRERHALEDYRKAMRDAADAIRGQIQRELAPGASHYSQRPELKGPAARRDIECQSWLNGNGTKSAPASRNRRVKPSPLTVSSLHAPPATT